MVARLPALPFFGKIPICTCGQGMMNSWRMLPVGPFPVLRDNELLKVGDASLDNVAEGCHCACAVLYSRVSHREMVWVVPTLVASGILAAGVGSRGMTTRLDEDGDGEDDEDTNDG